MSGSTLIALSIHTWKVPQGSLGQAHAVDRHMCLNHDRSLPDQTTICNCSFFCVRDVRQSRREMCQKTGLCLRIYKHFQGHISSAKQLFSNSALKQLNVGHLESWMSLLNPQLNRQHMAQITTAEGACLFCPWHLLLLTYAGSCFILISFLRWITGRITAVLWEDGCK